MNNIAKNNTVTVNNILPRENNLSWLSAFVCGLSDFNEMHPIPIVKNNVENQDNANNPLAYPINFNGFVLS